MIGQRGLGSLIVAVAALGLGAGCSGERLMAVIGMGKPPEKAVLKPPVVTVGYPLIKEVVDYEEFVGQTMAQNTVEIRARVTGYLDKVNFVDGSEVVKDAVLCEVDPRSYDAEVARTQASIVQGEAHLKRLDADYRRAQSLIAREVMPREEFDKVSGDYAEAAAAIGILKANYDLAKLNQNFCKVTAPISGRISRRMVDPGNLVRSDDTLITTIVSLDPMYLYFDIDERTLLKIRRMIREGKMKSREEANVTVDAALADEEGFPHQGMINFSENRIDPGTGTLRVRAVLANPKPKGSALGLRVFSPGLFMRIRLPIGDPHKAILLPEKALVSNQGQKSVWVVTPSPQNNVESRPVIVGTLHDGLRVIESGIKEGERVVVEGLQRVPTKADREGNRKVDPREVKATATPLMASTSTAAPADTTPAAAPATK